MLFSHANLKIFFRNLCQSVSYNDVCNIKIRIFREKTVWRLCVLLCGVFKK